MRVAQSDTSLGGLHVPQGSAVVASPETLGRDPASWERPDDFVPERWLQGRAPPTGAYLPFGAGPRACIGQQASLLVATLAIAHLVRSAHDGEDDGEEGAVGLEPEESQSGVGIAR